jgi:hypothetical protein
MSNFRCITLLVVALIVLGLGNAAYADSLPAPAVPFLRAAVPSSTALSAPTLDKSTPGFQAAGAGAKAVSSALVVLPVPEPGTSTLLICGLASLALVCRKFARA